MYGDTIEREGVTLFQQVCALDLEGIVAKHRDGIYLDGTTGRTSWMKIKNPEYPQVVGRDALFKNRARSARALSI